MTDNYSISTTQGLVINEDDVLVAEAKVQNKSHFPTTILGTAFVAMRILRSNYVTKHPMVHTDGARFKTLVDAFIELLTNVEKATISQSGIVEERKKLELFIVKLEKSLKAVIKAKHFDLFGNWVKRYGFITDKKGGISWGTKIEERLRNMGKAVETLKLVGHEGFEYTLEQYETTYLRYKNLVEQKFDGNTLSPENASKNQLRNEIDKLFRSIMYNIKSNYPDIWKAKAIEVGFLKGQN